MNGNSVPNELGGLLKPSASEGMGDAPLILFRASRILSWLPNHFMLILLFYHAVNLLRF